MSTTAILPSQKQRQRARMAAAAPPAARNRVARAAQDRRPLEALLASAGWTREDLHQVRAIPNEHLTVLIATLPPDNVTNYVAWGQVAARARLTPPALRDLITGSRDLPGRTTPEARVETLGQLLNYAQGYARRHPDRFHRESLLPTTEWAIGHLQAGNQAPEAGQFDYSTPPWLIAWLRDRGDLPCGLRDLPVGEQHVWSYIDAAATYPEAPERVLAETVVNAPSQPPAGDQPLDAWLRAAWGHRRTA